MPRYFFETDDGTDFRHDPEGLVLDNDLLARLEALRALPDMARDMIPDGDQRTFTSTVRNEDGDIVYTATMTLAGKWHKAKIIPIR